MNPGRKQEWFDNEKFWRDFYLFMFSDKRFTEAEDHVSKLLDLVKPKGKSILDLCCGPGRFSIPFASRGFRVTAVDKTRYLVNKARAKARRAKVAVEWVQQDMRDFVRPKAFDLIVNMFTSFGYFEEKDEDLRVLSNVYQSLRAGGSFVIDLMGKEVLARIAQPTLCDVLPDGSKLVQRPVVSEGWTRVRNEWLLIHGSRVKRFEFENTIYSGRELTDLLLQAGFGDVRLYGSLEGEEYGLNAKRLIAVAKKSA